MKKLSLLLLCVLGLSAAAFADDQKLDGKAVCAKCELHQADSCRAAIQVTSAAGKTDTYLTEPGDQAKALHSEICQGGKAVTAEGTVSEKDGVKTIKLTKYAVK